MAGSSDVHKLPLVQVEFAALIRAMAGCSQEGPGTSSPLTIPRCLHACCAGASIYWLLSAGLKGLPVGAVAQQHGDAAAELAAELLPLAQRYVLASGRLQGLASLDQARACCAQGAVSRLAAVRLCQPWGLGCKQIGMYHACCRRSASLAQSRLASELDRCP